MEPVKIGILGCGTVGCGTVKVLQENAKEIARRAGREIQIAAIAVKDSSKPRDCDLSSIPILETPFDLVSDPNIDIIVELIGGTQQAHDLVCQAIQSNKHVVTANKALIATKGNEIFRAAREQGVIVAFEAAVAGGIPIIKALREGLSANHIHKVIGIINGTCNYILSQMHANNSEFDNNLKQAQALGYAEADPSFDIDGVDVGHKLAILSAIAFGIPLQFNAIYLEGIRQLSPVDIQYASELGYTVKHLGITKRHLDGIECRVHPALVSSDETLAHVNDVMNAVLVYADALGPSLYMGAGAGALPTASAVVADIVDVTRALTVDPNNRVPHLAFQAKSLESYPLLPIEEVESAYYLRMTARDVPGVLADITQILAHHQISIESILQKESDCFQGTIPVVIVTQVVIEKNMQTAVKSIENLQHIIGAVTLIRIEHLSKGHAHE